MAPGLLAEILVFLFFMITDPKTIPAGPRGRLVYAVGVGLLATLLIAPFTSEFATKVAILAALFVVCATRGALELLGSERLSALLDRRPERRVIVTVALAGALAYAGLVVAAGIPARPDAEPALAAVGAGEALPEVRVVDTEGVARIDEAAARSIARDIVVDLRIEAEALESRDLERAAEGAAGEWLATLWGQIRASSGRELDVTAYDVESMELSLSPGDDQGPPTVSRASRVRIPRRGGWSSRSRTGATASCARRAGRCS